MDDFNSRFPRTAAAIDDGIVKGLHIGAQFYLSKSGETLANHAVGQSRPAIAMTPDTIMIWFSAGKPLGAVAIAKLWEAGALELDDPVARHIPEFAVKGKQSVTIRHLLTHTGGFRWADYQPTMPWATIIERICNAPLEPRWIPAITAGYHAFTSWYILAEIIRRVDSTGRDYSTFIHDEIFQPLGMEDCFLSIPVAQHRAFGDRIGMMQATGTTHIRPNHFDTEAGCEICAPGASARGPIHELGKFYEMFLNRGRTAGGKAFLLPQTVEALTPRHRAGIHDLTFKQTVDWGLGFIINSARYGEQSVPYGYGPHASPRTFGHGGSQSSTAFADPENKLAVAIVFNGMPGEIPHHQRMRAVTKAIYEDLNLATESGY